MIQLSIPVSVSDCWIFGGQMPIKGTLMCLLRQKVPLPKQFHVL